MKRGATVVSVSIGLAVAVASAVVYSRFLADRSPVRPPNQPGNTVSSLLSVMTWGPASVKSRRPTGLQERTCRSMGPALVLHGLWPQPKSQQLCGCSEVRRRPGRKHTGNDMPSLDLPDDVQARLGRR